MRRLILVLALLTALALPSSVLGFHHGGLPSTSCASVAAGSPSDDNGNAKEALTGMAGLTLPLAPVGTPGNGQGQGGEHCANAEDD